MQIFPNCKAVTIYKNNIVTMSTSTVLKCKHLTQVFRPAVNMMQESRAKQEVRVGFAAGCVCAAVSGALFTPRAAWEELLCGLVNTRALRGAHSF